MLTIVKSKQIRRTTAQPKSTVTTKWHCGPDLWYKLRNQNEDDHSQGK